MMVFLVFSFGRLYFLTCTSNNEPLQFAGKKWGMLIASQTLRMGRELGCGFGKLRPHFFCFFLVPYIAISPLGWSSLNWQWLGNHYVRKSAMSLLNTHQKMFFFFFFSIEWSRICFRTWGSGARYTESGVLVPLPASSMVLDKRLKAL